MPTEKTTGTKAKASVERSTSKTGAVATVAKEPLGSKTTIEQTTCPGDDAVSVLTRRWPFELSSTPPTTKKPRSFKKKKSQLTSLAPAKYELPKVLPANILIRIKSESGKTILAHQEVIQTRGIVLFGKLGPAIGIEFQNILNQQVADGVETYLFLMTREGWGGLFTTYRCRLVRAHDKLPRDKESLIPGYLRRLVSLEISWFEISSCNKMKKEEMDRIFTQSPQREILSVINTRATVFRVVVAQISGSGQESE